RSILTASPDERSRLYEELYAATPEWAVHVRDQIRSLPRRHKRRGMYRRLLGGNHRAILEIGCGSGDLTWALSDLANRTVGIDISPERVEAAKKIAPPELSGRKVEFHAMNAAALDFPDGSFDAAISTSMIEHLHPDDVDTHLREVRRVLAIGGRYLVWCPNRLGHHKDQEFHLCMMSYADLIARMTRAGFSRFQVPLFAGPPLVNAKYKTALERAMAALRIKILWSHLGIRNICLIATRNGDKQFEDESSTLIR
ncbi:MAG: class I SAM-dependent methyltransferase, partial [Candidatus Binataceae bacterium]